MTMNATQPRTTAHTAPPHVLFTRPLTDHELHTIVFALTEGIGRQRKRLRNARSVNPRIYDELRTAAEALSYVTDHICNDHRWGDDDGADNDDDEAGTPDLKAMPPA
jgi:hypothetical protein